MKLYLIILYAFSYSVVYLNAQSTPNDSLINLYENSEIDSIKLNAINELTKALKIKSTSDYFYYSKKGYHLAEKLKKHKAASAFLANMSSYFLKENKIDSALKYIDKAHNHALKSGNTLAIAGTKSREGDIYMKSGNYTKASEAYFYILEMEELKENPQVLLSCYTAIGQLYQSQGQLEKAAKYIKKNVPLCESLGERKAYCYSVVYNNLSMTFLESENYDSAIFYGNKSIENKRLINDLRGLELALNNVGQAFTQQQKYVEAEEKHTEALKVSKQINNINGIFNSHNFLASLFFKTHKISAMHSSINVLDSLQHLIKEPSQYKSYLKNKISYEESVKNYKRALQYTQELDSLDNELQKNENLQTIANLETKYQTTLHQKEKLEAETKELLAQNKAKRSRYLSLLFIGISLVLIGVAYYINNRLSLIRTQKQELDKAYAALDEQKKNELAVSNLKALQSQMNPHFIFNALNSVQDLVLLKDIRSSNKYLGKFSDLIRKILLSSKKQFISLSEEIEILSLYLDLEKLRFGNDFIINFSCDVPENQRENIKLPAMFIQPYIENAIKHGLLHKSGEKILNVSFSHDNDYLICTIEDNGIGQKKAAEIKKKRLHLHIGFSSNAISERIQILNQTLEKKINVYTENLFQNNKAAGTKVTLMFPI